MIKKLALGFLLVGVATVTANAGHRHHHSNPANLGAADRSTAVDSLPASDKASNYPGGTWTAATNFGVGFGAWSFAATGGGGHFIGATGETEATSFGLFAGGTGATDLSSADRQFTGALGAGQIFSLDMGSTANVTAGNIGINLLSGATAEFTFKFVSGASFWVLNDGGSDFNTTIPFGSPKKIHFAFTYNGGSSYSLSIFDGTTTYTANGFTATNPINNITGVRMFSNQQGGGENFGFNNLSIVPEPSTLSLLAGPAILAVWFYVRRRRNS